MSNAVTEQQAAAKEISRNLQQAAQSTQDVTTNIGGLSRAVGETGEASSNVLTAAGDLNERSGRLSGKVQTFLSSVRAAYSRALLP